MVATLTRIFGASRLDLVEDVVQEALVRALRQWSLRGVPADPSAWLFRVARNAALDALRRDATARDAAERESLAEKERALDAWRAEALARTSESDLALLPESLRDDQLRMIFACCHPAIGEDGRIALTLKTLGGFGVPEIARALLAKEQTIAQRIVRAKRRIREERIELELPEPDELPPRLDSVLQVVYLTFNEGYAAHRGAELVRADLVREALRLGSLLAQSPATDAPRVHALLALMLFGAARLPARVDTSGELLLLEHQDRSLWDAELTRRAVVHLARAGRGDELSLYHVEAGLAACHALAPSWEATDWPRILAWYDLLVRATPSPVARLNRAIAVAMVAGPAAGLAALAEVERHRALAGYYLLPATRGELLRRAGDTDGAAAAFRRALALECTEPERRFLERKLAACVSRPTPPGGT